MRQTRILRAVVLPGWKPGDPKRYAWPLFKLQSIPEPTPEQEKLSKAIFQNGARWLGDHTTIDSIQRQNWTELAILGRSNVGKSSLLNCLLGSRDHEFVPVGKRPGMTVALDFYGVGVADPPPLVIVDTPGYGYSSRGKATHTEWMESIERYLLFRKQTSLMRIMILLDSRYGITPNDKELLEALDKALLPTHLILTKVDLLTASELETTAAAVAQSISKLQMPFPVLNAVSSRTGEGLVQLQATLMQTSKIHRNAHATATADKRVRKLIEETAEAMHSRALSAMAAFQASSESGALPRVSNEALEGSRSRFPPSSEHKKATVAGTANATASSSASAPPPEHPLARATKKEREIRTSMASAEAAAEKAMQALLSRGNTGSASSGSRGSGSGSNRNRKTSNGRTSNGRTSDASSSIGERKSPEFGKKMKIGAPFGVPQGGIRAK